MYRYIYESTRRTYCIQSQHYCSIAQDFWLAEDFAEDRECHTVLVQTRRLPGTQVQPLSAVHNQRAHTLRSREKQDHTTVDAALSQSTQG